MNEQKYEQKYEIVGTLTRTQAEQVAELLAGSSVLWCKGHTYPCDGVVIRPSQGKPADEVKP